MDYGDFPRINADQYHEFNNRVRDDRHTMMTLGADPILTHNLFNLTGYYLCPFCLNRQARILKRCPQCKLDTCWKCMQTRWPKYMIEINYVHEPVLTKLSKKSGCCYCEGVGLQYPKDSPDDKEREWRYLPTARKRKETSYLVNRVTQKMSLIFDDNAFVEDHLTLDIKFYRPSEGLSQVYHSQSLNIEQIRNFIQNRDIDHNIINHPVKHTEQFKIKYEHPKEIYRNLPSVHFTRNERKLHINLEYFC